MSENRAITPVPSNGNNLDSSTGLRKHKISQDLSVKTGESKNFDQKSQESEEIAPIIMCGDFVIEKTGDWE